MKLVANLKPPKDLDQATRLLASAASLALAEARMRLSAEPPALLLRATPEQADAVVKELRGGGLTALAIDEQVPTDADRLLVRTFELGERAIFRPREGDALELPWDSIVAVLRGLSATRSTTEHTERSTKLALGTAVLTGGLKVTRSVERTIRTSSEETEQAIFVVPREGPVAVLRESVVDFSCLGKAMQPARTANVMALAQLLRSRAPKALYDERLARLGRRALPFVLGESRAQAGQVVTSRGSTASSLDVLVELMRRGLLEGLLP